MLSVTYGTDPDLCYSGGADGRVYHWRGSTLSKTVEAHTGPVYAVQRVEKVNVWSVRELRALCHITMSLNCSRCQAKYLHTYVKN